MQGLTTVAAISNGVAWSLNVEGRGKVSFVDSLGLSGLTVTTIVKYAGRFRPRLECLRRSKTIMPAGNSEMAAEVPFELALKKQRETSIVSRRRLIYFNRDAHQRSMHCQVSSLAVHSYIHLLTQHLEKAMLFPLIEEETGRDQKGHSDDTFAGMPQAEVPIEHPEHSDQMYMHYTIAEDHCGGNDAIRGAILARLGARCEGDETTRGDILARLGGC